MFDLLMLFSFYESENKKFKITAMEKHRGMAFGFRKTATAFKNAGQIDRKLFSNI